MALYNSRVRAVSEPEFHGLPLKENALPGGGMTTPAPAHQAWMRELMVTHMACHYNHKKDEGKAPRCLMMTCTLY